MGSCIKTYIIQFIYDEGNGWAFVNAHSVNQAEQVFKIQTKYKDVRVTGIKETKYYGEEMQLVYEGAVTSKNKSLYDLAILNDINIVKEGTITKVGYTIFRLTRQAQYTGAKPGCDISCAIKYI